MSDRPQLPNPAGISRQPVTVVDATEADSRPPSRAARWGAWVLALGLALIGLWAAFAPLDEGVPAQGLVSLDTRRTTVQHISGGIVRQVLVREGDVVAADQILIQLDDAAARANFEAVRQRYLGMRAVQGRLLAEQAGARGIIWHPDLLAAQDDPWIRAQMQTQKQLLATRRNGLRAELHAIEEAARAQQAMLQSYQDMQESRRQQLSLLQEELRHISDLVAEGYAPRLRQSELQRQIAEMQAALTELIGNMERTQRAIAELRERSQARQHEYRRQIETELTQVNLEVQADAERFRALHDELMRTAIRAPVAGQVIGLSVSGPGAVVQPGQRLLDIVPEDSPMLIEARLAPHLIDRVHPGLPTDVRFAAFAHEPQLVVAGEVRTVSQDLLTDAQTGAGYYLMRIAITDEGRRTLGPRRLQPGMPAEVIVKTGERSLLDYLVAPLLRRIATSLKEE